MEVSGVNRLLSLARELGVQPARTRAETRVERPSVKEPATRSLDEGGIRLTLSSQASADPTGAVADAGQNTPPPATHEVSSARSTGTAEAATSPRQRHAIAAYARNAASLPEERIQVRA